MIHIRKVFFHSLSRAVIFTFLFLVSLPCAQAEEKLIGEAGMESLAELSIEQLINLETTTVSKKAQKVSESAAAIFVLTQEDIRRSGVTSVPEALRLVPGMQVARLNANTWAVSSRGFNDVFADKLLVMIDGRSVYTPLFSGVFWDTEDVMLEDVERIEVVRGPGATLWGANAVNGVINIITKSSADTQGTLVSGGGGTEERGFAAVRHGGNISDSSTYRVYTKYFNRDDARGPDGADTHDAWEQVQGGFRIDSEVNEQDNVTLQGDTYYGEKDFLTTAPLLIPPFSSDFIKDTTLFGGNVLGRWTRTLADDSDLQLQVYYDHIDRNEVTVDQQRDTMDLDFQHRFQLNSWNEVIWGLGYRYYQDDLAGSPFVRFDPDSRDVDLLTAFIQNEMRLNDSIRLIAGSKFENNDFTDFEFQPSIRALGTLDEKNTVWAAVSRAVRTPSRAGDNILFDLAAIPGMPGAPTSVVTILGNDSVQSEDLLAYELGYRSQLTENLSIDIAGFYNDYEDLTTVVNGMPFFDPAPPRIVVPLAFANDQKGHTYGVEVAADWRPLDWWRLVGTYSYLDITIEPTSPLVAEVRDIENESPNNQFVIRSSFDLPNDMEFDTIVRYVDELSALDIDSYIQVDLRLAWHPTDNFELALVGQNLVEDHHEEYVSSFVYNEPAEVERAVYAKATWRFSPK